MSGVLGSTIPASLYVHLHKQYYAKRHGYKFLLQLSDKFVQYFPRALWQVCVVFAGELFLVANCVCVFSFIFCCAGLRE